MLFGLNMAAGNVRGAMRPQGRSPSFFIVGLFLTVAILGFNYWSLSKRNKDLASQLLNMQDQLRLCISKRMTVERRGSNIVNELRKCETALDMDKNEVARKESEVISLTEQLKNKEFQINTFETKLKEMEELRMSLKTCEENNNGIKQELQKMKEELKANPVNGLNAETCKICKGQWVFDQKTFLSGIDKVLGPAGLLQLKNAGVDIGNYALEISAQLKNSQSLKNNEVQQNPPLNNVSVVSRSVDNQDIAKAAVPSETGQNAVAAGSNTVLGVNSANSINKDANSPVINDENAGHSFNNNQGNAVPNNINGVVENQGRVVPLVNNNEGAVENAGAVVLPANNNEVDAANPGAVAPVNNNEHDAANPGAVAPPANNNDGDAGNPGAVVPPINNNDGVVPLPVIQDGENKNILSQNNNDALIGNPGGIVPLLNNNNEGGDVAAAANSLDSGGVVTTADKHGQMDVAGDNPIPTKSLLGNGAPAGNLNTIFGDNYPHQPKIESNVLKTSLLNMLKNNSISPENQFKIPPSLNDSKLLAVQDGVKALTSPQKGSDSVTSINVTESGAQNASQQSTNNAFGINAPTAVQMNPVSPADMVNSSVLTVNNTKTDSFNTGQGSAQRKPFNSSDTIKYLQTNSGPVQEDNLKGGINAIEDSIDKMQKNMNLDEDKMNSLDKNH